jgi:hypothetical protein
VYYNWAALVEEKAGLRLYLNTFSDMEALGIS